MKTIPVDKVCKLCKQKKLLVHFGVNDKTRDKRDRICKECRTLTSSSEVCQTHIPNCHVDYPHPELSRNRKRMRLKAALSIV